MLNFAPICCFLFKGEDPEYAIDITWPYLRAMNLKSACWLRVNGPEAESAMWKNYWTSGCHGMAYCPRVAAKYSDHNAVDRLISEDTAFARSLFDENKL
jgi:hypothetical protein